MFNEEALSIGTVIIGELNYPSKNWIVSIFSVEVMFYRIVVNEGHGFMGVLHLTDELYVWLLSTFPMNQTPS
jgi:hypothetical protein